MRGEGSLRCIIKRLGREWVPARDIGESVPPLAGRVEGRQRLKGARANANFKNKVTTFPIICTKLPLPYIIRFVSSRSSGVKFVKIGETLQL